MTAGFTKTLLLHPPACCRVPSLEFVLSRRHPHIATPQPSAHRVRVVCGMQPGTQLAPGLGSEEAVCPPVARYSTLQSYSRSPGRETDGLDTVSGPPPAPPAASPRQLPTRCGLVTPAAATVEWCRNRLRCADPAVSVVSLARCAAAAVGLPLPNDAARCCRRSPDFVVGRARTNG